MKKNVVLYIVLGLIGLLVIGFAIFMIWGILFMKQAGWKPPDDYIEPYNHHQPVEGDSIDQDKDTLISSDTTALNTLNEFLEREQYGSIPDKIRNMGKSR